MELHNTSIRWTNCTIMGRSGISLKAAKPVQVSLKNCSMERISEIALQITSTASVGLSVVGSRLISNGHTIYITASSYVYINISESHVECPLTYRGSLYLEGTVEGGSINVSNSVFRNSIYVAATPNMVNFLLKFK